MIIFLTHIRIILCLAFMLIHLAVSANTEKPVEDKNVFIELVSVSVLPGDVNNPHWVHIKWELTGGDSDGYVVVHRVRADGLGSDPVSGPIDYDVSEWIDTTAAPSLRSEIYYVVYEDETTNPSAEYHHTIFLQTEPYVDECEMKITLRWDDYVITNLNQDTLPSIFGCNKVFVSVDGGAETQYGPSIAFGQAQYRVYTGLIPGSTYRFRVQACLEGNDTLLSFSNPSALITFDPDWPEEVRVNWVNVTDEGVMQLNVASDGDYPELLYVVSRSGQETGPFSEISTIPLDASVTIEDPVVRPEEGPWFYQVDVINECDSVILRSIAVSGIFLKVDAFRISEGRIDLTYSWEHTPPWSDYVLEYKSSPAGSFSPLNGQTFTVPGSSSLNEPVSLLEQSGELFLRMAATDGSATIHSNVVRITLEPELTVPNAFRPDSHLPANQLFRPELNLTPASYELRIYNRWQQLIFSSNDPAEAWDGTWNGEAVPEGVYAWVLEYQIASGKKQSSMGSVMLVR